MDIRRIGWFIPLLTLFVVGIVSSHAPSKDTSNPLEALGEALKEERYLDAYDQYFIMNDSTPSSLIAGLNPPDTSDLNKQTRIFLLLFSRQVQMATSEVAGLPETTFTMVMQAVADEIEGSANDAKSAFSQAVEHVTNKAQFYGLMAAVGFVTGDPENVLANSNKAIEIALYLASAYRLRGIGKLFTGHPEDAIKDADYAIKLDPSMYFFHYLRGNAHFVLGDIDAVMKDVNAGLAINDHSVIGYAMRSQANLALNNVEEAARDFAKSIASRTNNIVESQPLLLLKSAQIEMTFGTTFHSPFYAQAGQSVNIKVASVEAGVVDPDILLLDPDGTPLVFNDDASEETLDAAINGYTLAKGGTYTLVISHANGGSDGQLDVLISPA